jgi:phosphatidylserine/phosphatidylglycerophosphate/cardiolipin synthase-like enzyme
MGQTFSLPSSGLRYLLGYSLVHKEHVAICTPWLSDVELRLPLSSETDVDDRRASLSAALKRFDTQVDVYIREGESHNEYVLSRIEKRANITKDENLHAKAIVTDEYVYLGSANITRGGLLTNLELCQVIENDYDDVEDYLEDEIGLSAPP